MLPWTVAEFTKLALTKLEIADPLINLLGFYFNYQIKTPCFSFEYYQELVLSQHIQEIYTN